MSRTGDTAYDDCAELSSSFANLFESPRSACAKNSAAEAATGCRMSLYSEAAAAEAANEQGSSGRNEEPTDEIQDDGGSAGSEGPSQEQHPYSYGDRVYWDRRYAAEVAPGSTAAPSFDWYLGYKSLCSVLREHISLTSSVLQVGVGTSTVQHDMVQDGYSNILSTDNSAVVVEYMRALHEDVLQLQYALADCRHMPQFAAGSFDAVLDKGTLDAILCGKSGEADAAHMLAECCRVLRPGGVLVEMSFGPPCRRLPYLLLPTLDWEVCVYGMRKGHDDDEGRGQRLKKVIGPYLPHDTSHLDSSGLEIDGYYLVYICKRRS